MLNAKNNDANFTPEYNDVELSLRMTFMKKRDYNINISELV